MRQTFLAPLVLLTAVALTGCPDDPKDPPNIVSFSASSTSLPPGGGEVRLSWVQANGTEQFIDQGVGAVDKKLNTRNVFVSTTTTFTLTVSNKLGTAQKSVTVTVQDPTSAPVITGFTATPWQLPILGGDTKLMWSQNQATSLFIDNGIGNVTGKTEITVKNLKVTTTFTLTATNSLGTTTAQTTVTVIVPTEVPTVNFFSVTPANLGINGGTVTLSWDVTGYESISIDKGVGTVTNKTSQNVSVTQTTTFTLTATNVIGSSTETATVTVYVPNAPPSIHSFSADDTFLPPGGDWVRLSWATTDAQTLTIDNGVGSVTGRTWVDVRVYSTTAFKLRATNVRGSSESIVLVQVQEASPPQIFDFSANPSSRVGAGYVTLQWSTANASTLSIDNGVGDVTNEGGSTQVWVSSSTRFYLTARNSAGQTVTRFVDVDVN